MKLRFGRCVAWDPGKCSIKFHIKYRHSMDNKGLTEDKLQQKRDIVWHNCIELFDQYLINCVIV